jgi:hypothetical protein
MAKQEDEGMFPLTHAAPGYAFGQERVNLHRCEQRALDQRLRHLHFVDVVF